MKGQIVAQETKIKVWEIVVTKVSILHFVMQKYKTLVFVINLISILQSSHLNESVCFVASASNLLLLPLS